MTDWLQQPTLPFNHQTPNNPTTTRILQKKRFPMRILATTLLLCLFLAAKAQNLVWSADGNSYYALEASGITQHNLATNATTTLVPKAQLQAAGNVQSFAFGNNAAQLLLFANTQKVWRLNTRGEYHVYNITTQKLHRLGQSLPAASLMFAKLSPDGKQAAYVSQQNIYVEDLATGKVRPLTKGGNRQTINGTFDWAYEEEFFCRDGFRWSPDGKKIAFWQINANNTKDYLMLDNTSGIYPKAIPVEYPVAGEKPSVAKIGVVDVATAATQWMQLPDDAQWGSYIPRMEWAANGNELILQHLNRLQNHSQLMLCDVRTGKAKTVFSEKETAWIDILPLWDEDYGNGGWDWLDNGRSFVWASEKDGWRHLYKISRDGKTETLITKGNYDVMGIDAVDEKEGYIYFHASPDNATQKYLYRSKLDGSGEATRLTPQNQPGTHTYKLSPNGRFARQQFSNHYTPPVKEWVSLPAHQPLDGDDNVAKALRRGNAQAAGVEFTTITTAEGVSMDAWVVKPRNFDAAKKYPVVFYVYTEPWGQNVKDEYGTAHNFLYNGDMAGDGYVYVSIDNRGTPCPKGRQWRKSVYRQIGRVNIKDQAMAAKEVLKWSHIDSSRVAVWGWSGGGSATLNLMFQYPEIYKTGIAVAAVGNQLTYDNIYQERYMGLPQQNRADFVNGSPITYAKNLRGNLLYIHGTGDDNVHYNNAEMLIDELVKYNKQFQLMSYPNRTHSISEGEGTFTHLSTLYTNFLKQHCPPGGR
jgi:dipeptidyl-peptidase 4